MSLIHDLIDPDCRKDSMIHFYLSLSFLVIGAFLFAQCIKVTLGHSIDHAPYYVIRTSNYISSSAFHFN